MSNFEFWFSLTSNCSDETYYGLFPKKNDNKKGKVMSEILEIKASYDVDRKFNELMFSFRVKFKNSIKEIVIQKQFFLNRDEIQNFYGEIHHYQGLAVEHLEYITNLKKEDMNIVWKKGAVE